MCKPVHECQSFWVLAAARDDGDGSGVNWNCVKLQSHQHILRARCTSILQVMNSCIVPVHLLKFPIHIICTVLLFTILNPLLAFRPFSMSVLNLRTCKAAANYLVTIACPSASNAVTKYSNWRVPWKNRISSTTTRKSLVKPVSDAAEYIELFGSFSERPSIYASSCLTISGGRTEQHIVIGFG